MVKLKPHVRFLLRGSALLAGMLAFWWLALQPPLLSLLNACEAVVLREPVAVDDSGDWNFRVTVDDSAVTGKFNSIEFTIPRPDVVLFTFSLPVYWAIVLAAGWGKATIRALLWGTAVVLLIEVLSLFTQVKIFAYASLAQLHSLPGGWEVWMREFGTRMITGVIPFAAPMLIAVGLHRGLRSQVFTPPARFAS